MNCFYLFAIFSNLFYFTSSQFQFSYIKTIANGTCGISTGAPIVQQLTKTITYAGGLFYADLGEKIAYIDRYRPAIGRYTPSDGRFNQLPINKGKEAICIFPIKNDMTQRYFLVGLDNTLQLAVISGTTNNLQGTFYNMLTITNKPEKFEKGRIDALGRLWYSSKRTCSHCYGKLYKIENLNSPIIMENSLHSGGGMAWTQDNRNFYLVDSGIGVIYKYDFNLQDGTITNKRPVFELSDHKELYGTPFDIALDTAGSLWIGMQKGGAVIQYDENSREILWSIAVPASDIVSIEFGGPLKNILFVGTSKQEEQPASGAIFSISGLGVTGIPDNDIVIPGTYTDYA